jgi:hypothetical protein
MTPAEINYRAKSNMADKSCGVCTNFQPVENSKIDGNCFGNKVTAEGLCNYFTPVVIGADVQTTGRAQKSA